MGLDACVYCDCFERGRLRTPPRPEWGVHVDEYGMRRSAVRNYAELLAFEAWDSTTCEHEEGILLEHRLGNVALIGDFHERLQPVADRLPVFMTKVVYSGSHGGDILELADVERLRDEIEVLAEVHAENDEDEQFLRGFEQQLRELTDASLRVRKPIVF